VARLNTEQTSVVRSLAYTMRCYGAADQRLRMLPTVGARFPPCSASARLGLFVGLKFFLGVVRSCRCAEISSDSVGPVRQGHCLAVQQNAAPVPRPLPAQQVGRPTRSILGLALGSGTTDAGGDVGCSLQPDLQAGLAENLVQNALPPGFLDALLDLFVKDGDQAELSAVCVLGWCVGGGRGGGLLHGSRHARKAEAMLPVCLSRNHRR
jgi:hypothetical protein